MRASSPRSAGDSSRPTRAGACELEALEDAQRFEGGDALAVRRNLPDVVAAVVDAQIGSTQVDVCAARSSRVM